MRSVPSSSAEQSMAMVMRELVEYRRRLQRSDKSPVGRMVTPRLASTTLSPTFGAVVSMVSIAEEFFGSTLRSKIEDSFDTITRMYSDARRDALKKIDTNWEGRLGLGKRWFGVDTSAEVSFLELMAFVEARNSITHGLGKLTQRQLSPDGGKKVIEQLATVNIPVIGGRIFIDATALSRCANAARDAIEWSDLALRAAQPIETLSGPIDES